MVKNVKNGRKLSKIIKQITFTISSTNNSLHFITGRSSVRYHIGTCPFSRNRGLPKTNPDLVPNYGPFLALWSGSGPSPEFRTFLTTLDTGPAQQVN